ncbi:MAG TPA: polysaccharide biosynthesis/export family protein [Candidatus Binataceae bacterium]
MKKAKKLARALAVAAMAAWISGCAAGTNATATGDGASGQLSADNRSSTAPLAATALVSEGPAARQTRRALAAVTAFSVTALKNPDDRQRLLRLWQERTAPGPSADFVLGPGDVIEISVPVIAELKDRTERISANGTITLPFIGTIEAAGLTETQLKAAFATRLTAVMYQPQIDLFVKQYRSRQVAVVGQVDKPGLYALSGPDGTLLDLLNDAGGINKDAAMRVLFIPAHEQAASAVATALGGRVKHASTVPAPAGQELMRQRDPIVIGLGDLSSGGDPAALMLPARPGDMLVVPGAGEVVVQGWVDKPGSYRITPGLTLAGAVGAAGGASFAANQSAITIMREGADGKRIFIAANLDQIDAGQEPDITVQEGDVVSVPYSAVKLVPYAAISLIGKGIYFSAAAPVF